jgi:hypothetical protein
MAVEPTIEVTEESVTIQDRTPGMAGRIAIIGAFDSKVNNITVVSDDTTAHSIFGTTETLNAFKGTDVIDQLFLGASELLVANITTWTGDDEDTPETVLTNQKLTDALAKLKHETFDLLFIAEELTDEAQTMVTTWLNKEFKDKFAHSQVIPLQKSTAAAYEASIATIGKQVAYINTQPLTYNGTSLNLNQSAAVMAGIIASMGVGESLTAKLLDGVTGCTEYTTETGDIGAKLMELNVPIIKCRNRRLNQYICVNSMLPNGLDMYINRSRDYIINTLEAELLLGQSSSDLTLEGAQMIVENVRKEVVDDLKIVEDIIYEITKEDSQTVVITLTKLVFNGIITKVKVKYSIEVQ